jgi:hypothetical protein
LIYEIFSCNGVVGSGGASKVYERGRRREVIWYGQCMIKYMVFHDLLVKLKIAIGPWWKKSYKLSHHGSVWF